MRIKRVFLFLLIFCVSACGDTSDSETKTGDDAGTSDSVDLDCPSVCESKLSACQDPGSASQCAQLCQQLTQAQVVCFRDADCQTLLALSNPDELCSPGGNEPDAGPGDECDPAYCDGDSVVRCELVDGVKQTSTNSCPSGCDDGQCVGPPTTVRITGTYEPSDPIGAQEGDTATTSASMGAESLEYSEVLPDEINFNDDSVVVTVESPDPGECDYSPMIILSADRLTLSLVGEDTLPALDCSNFIREANSAGVTFLAAGVPYLNLGGTLDVTVELSPR